MVNRLLSFVSLSLLLASGITQPQGAAWRLSFKVPAIATLAVVSAASLLAYTELYEQKNDDIKTYNAMKEGLKPENRGKSLTSILRDQVCKNKAELEWAWNYDWARSKQFDTQRAELVQSIAQNIQYLNNTLQETDTGSLVNLYRSLYIDLHLSLQKDALTNWRELLVPKFKPSIMRQMSIIRQDLGNPKLTSQYKEQLRERKKLMNSVLQTLEACDFYCTIDQKRKEKLEELERKIIETPKARNRLWVVPVVLNCFTAIFAGLTYLGAKA